MISIEELIKQTKYWLDTYADHDNEYWSSSERKYHRELVETNKRVLELAEKAEKYKWNKKPETGWTEKTLPEKHKLILFETSTECFLGERIYSSTFYSYSDSHIREYIKEYDKEYIECWKYYEPSEGED